MRPIVVVGEGGHSKVVQDIISAEGIYRVTGILDDKYKGTFEKDKIIYGPVSYAEKLIKSKAFFIIAIGNNHIRKEIAERLRDLKARFASVIHPSAIISPSVSIGFGTAVMANSVINADTVVGSHAIINTSAVVEHDNVIGNYVHISPGAILTGDVQVDEGSQIGAGSTIIPGKTIGEWSMIAAGATVINNIPAGMTAVGVPAKIVEKE
ncbi:acetyltransferase [Lederbergia citrea]|uniref:acetyltransferase n=1 Tax=Lederbergia citrea TaxID=2833581 RepID=UPI001BC9F0CE|nr:acetyltransferase [Lederbergia citrea]MBS4204808.1 acetyltransferase [Lederbergia citrea]